MKSIRKPLASLDVDFCTFAPPHRQGKNTKEDRAALFMGDYERAAHPKSSEKPVTLVQPGKKGVRPHFFGVVAGQVPGGVCSPRPPLKARVALLHFCQTL